MRNLFILFLLVLLSACQRQARVIDYQPFSPKGMDDLITTNIHHYKTGITAMRKNDMWKDFVQQFPDDLYTDKKYKFLFFPGFLQGGPFMVLQIDFNSETEGKYFFEEHSKNYKLQFSDIDSMKLSAYCTFSDINDSILQQYALFRFFDKNICATDNDSIPITGGIYSGIFLGKDNRRIYCFAEDGRL